MLVAATLIPGAMATCSVNVIAGAYDKGFHGDSDLIAGFSSFVLPLALIILLIIIHSMLLASYRGRINFKSLLPFCALLAVFCIVWGGFSLWAAVNAHFQDEAGFVWASLVLCILTILNMVYFLVRDYKRRSAK